VPPNQAGLPAPSPARSSHLDSDVYSKMTTDPATSFPPSHFTFDRMFRDSISMDGPPSWAVHRLLRCDVIDDTHGVTVPPPLMARGWPFASPRWVAGTIARRDLQEGYGGLVDSSRVRWQNRAHASWKRRGTSTRGETDRPRTRSAADPSGPELVRRIDEDTAGGKVNGTRGCGVSWRSCASHRRSTP
jgi:hypothetical protein